MSNKTFLQSKQLLESTIRAILAEAGQTNDAVLKIIKNAYVDPNDDTIAAAAEACLSSGVARAHCDDILNRLQNSAKTPEAGEVVTRQIAKILDDPENWSRFTKSAKKQNIPLV